MNAREGQVPVEFVYGNVGAPDLYRRGFRPETAHDGHLLVDIEADLVIRDGDRVVLAEKLFPVAELAHALAGWLQRPGGEHGDFVFDSMSCAEPGAVRMVESAEGWRVGSVFAPDAWTSPVTWDALAAEAGRFVAAVREDVVEIGVRPGRIPGL
ncbi:DUF7878 domain-containing protein [Streptomyces rimosus]|uniref:DUF7878 domain-containing protein n=1 Tax=Streptomyces rimosus TaxID=1927 RepID=UPI0037D1B13C